MNASSRHRFAAAGILAITLSALAQAQAAEIPGKVRSSTNKYATVVSDSDLVPVPGDKAQIYFKLPGIDVEVSVAMGHVYEITGPNIMVQIDSVTGSVAEDQLVRITSPNPKKKGELQAAAGSPSALSTQAATGLSSATTAARTPPPLQPTPSARPMPPSATAPEPSSTPETALNVLTFDQLQAGPLSPDAFAARGVRVVGGIGEPGVYRSERNMVLPPGRNNVLLLGGGARVTSLTIAFRAPIKRFSLTRIGTAGGASVPTWRLEALDGAGKVVGSVGEAHGLPQTPQQFSVVGDGIVRVQLSTDNRFGKGTWATWSSLPVVEFEFEY